MDFSKEAIQQGRANQDASAETPETFSRLDGAFLEKVQNFQREIVGWQGKWVLVHLN